MLVAILDTETTGLDIKEAKILEIAIVIYDTSAARVVCTRSFLINYPDLHVAKEITDINGLTRALCADYGSPLDEAMWIVTALLSKCDCVIAHHGAFDFSLLERHINIPVPKICSKVDIKWGARHTSKRLVHLCADYGCTLLPAHTALSDCLMLLDLLIKVNVWGDFAGIISHRKNKVTLDGK